MRSPVVYDFNAFSKLKTIVKHSLQINFIFPGAPGWWVHAADALSIVGGGAERRWGTPRAAPLSPAHPGPRPEVAMTATDASLQKMGSGFWMSSLQHILLTSAKYNS